MTRPVFRYLFIALATGWAGVIFILSSQPGIDMPPLFPGHDKLMHAAAFGMLGFLVLGALRPRPQGYRPMQVWLAVTLVAVYGVLDEVHQSFVPGRNPDMFDVIADISGGMIGVWLMYVAAGRLLGSSSGVPPARF